MYQTSTAAKDTFFPNSCGTASRIDSVSYKTRLNILKRTETIQSIFSHHNEIKLGKKNTRGKFGKFSYVGIKKKELLNN